MPLGVKPSCFKCNSINSEIWQKTKEGNIVCNPCYGLLGIASKPSPSLKTDSNGKAPDKTEKPEFKVSTHEQTLETAEEEDVTMMEELVGDAKPRNDGGPGTRSGNSSNRGGGKTGPRKSRGRSRKLGALGKTAVTKGRGRRAIFKKQPPTKAPSNFATTTTIDHLFHKDIYYQVGDIVSVVDEEDGVYYAQIRGLLQDQFCEKSAVLTWLIPTQSSPPPDQGFDPLTYILGPEEELPRKLEYLDFVMRAPSEYYKLDDKIRISNEKEAGFIWTSMGAVKRTIHV